MKAMNKKSYICTALVVIKVLVVTIFISSCSYNELPPKTDSANDNYILPAGVLPSSEEKQVQQEARDEYNNFLKQE